MIGRMLIVPQPKGYSSAEIDSFGFEFLYQLKALLLRYFRRLSADYSVCHVSFLDDFNYSL